MKTKDQQILEEIYTQNVNRNLLLEYKEPFIKKQIERLKTQGGRHVTDDDIRADIERFDQLKTNSTLQVRIKNIVNDIELDEQGDEKEKEYIERLKKDPLDITRYRWKELTHVVHQFAPPEKKVKVDTGEVGGVNNLGAKLLLQFNGLKIYYASTPEEAVIFQQYLNDNILKQPKEIRDKIKPLANNRPAGETYGWCIGWSGRKPLFDTYRFAGDQSASVYYVLDTEKELTDLAHILVIHAQRDGKYRLTTAFNTKEVPNTTWDYIVSTWQPKLNEDARKKIVYHPLSLEEEARVLDIYKERNRPINADLFKELNTYKAKEMYIVAYGRKGRLYKADYLKIDPKLQHLYINIACHPAAGESGGATYRIVYYPFADSDRERPKIAAAKSIEILEPLLSQEGELDTAYLEPLLQDPIILQSKNSQTIKLWRRFGKDAFDMYILGTRHKRDI